MKMFSSHYTNNDEQPSTNNNSVNQFTSFHVGTHSMSPKDCDTPTRRPPPPPPHEKLDQEAKAATTKRTATVATTKAPTMTSTAVTIEAPTCVSARCYLIGKMINDANRALRNVVAAERRQATNTSTKVSPANLPVSGADIEGEGGAEDLPVYVSSTINNVKIPDSTNTETATSASSVTAENLNEECNLTTTTSAVKKESPSQQLQQQQQPTKIKKSTAGGAQSKPMENKCSSKELTIFSCQREVESQRTSQNIELEKNKHKIGPLTRNRITEERAEGPKTQQEHQRLQQHQQLRFAERNNRLKSDFLKNAYGISSRRAHLKSRIPGRPQLEKNNQTEAVLKSSTISLVAQRTLELNLKFEEQPTQKEYKHRKNTFSQQTFSAPQDRYARFPSVRQLIHKFDSQAAIMMLDPVSNVSDTDSPGMPTPTPASAAATATNLLPSKRNTHEQRHSPLSDEGCNLGQSPYSSDEDSHNHNDNDNDNDNASIRTASTTVERTRKDKVARSASSDSALGLDVDESLMDTSAIMEQQQRGPEYELEQQPLQHQAQQQRRMTLTVTDIPLRPALLPLAEPTALPDSPPGELQSTLSTLIAQSAVPSKVLLEERVVEIHEEARSPESRSSSRRESAQSCFSDYPITECGGGVRFVRTPSVVVSDYSDDIMCGITLEEIEYFRAQRMRRRSSLDTGSFTEKDGADGAGGGCHSDVSASSSCSNLYYCGSTISALDGSECFVNGSRMPLNAERKSSACSTCSATSCGEDEELARFGIAEQAEDPAELQQELAVLLATQHLSTTKRQKKVRLRKCGDTDIFYTNILNVNILKTQQELNNRHKVHKILAH